MYDSKVNPGNEAAMILQWIDASALLWRLHLEGAETGDRFQKLAASWERTIEDGHYAFNDLHAIMAFLGAGRRKDAERVVVSMRRAALAGDDNAYMCRAVGIPLGEAFLAFDAGRYGETVEKIAAVRGIAQRFGGSHAQRDIFSLTAVHAALRGGLKQTAEAFANERVAHKPESPWAQQAGRARTQASSAAGCLSVEILHGASQHSTSPMGRGKGRPHPNPLPRQGEGALPCPPRPHEINQFSNRMPQHSLRTYR